MKLNYLFYNHIYLPIKHVIRKLYYIRTVRRLAFFPTELLDKAFADAIPHPSKVDDLHWSR